MPMLVDIRAFLVTARLGGFSAAGRELEIATSVISKRVNRLEHELGTPLFVRSTRKLDLTPEGARLRPQLQALVAELDETLSTVSQPDRKLRGLLRVRSPTTIGTMFVGPSIARFQRRHTNIAIELSLVDRLLNPLEEGFDISFGALPQSFASVEEVPICPYPRVLVASPEYLAANGAPSSPSDIASHECLAFVPVGLSWIFTSARGPITVDIRARYTVNDSRLLADAAIEGIGLTVVPEFLARDALAAGSLVTLLPDYPIQPLWFKAMVPSHKMGRPEVVALIDHVKGDFDPMPWDTESGQSDSGSTLE